MTNTLTYNKIELLPDHLKNEVNDFVDFLILKEKKKLKSAPKEENSIMKFAGILSDEEGEELKNIIEDGCGKVDLNDWK